MYHVEIEGIHATIEATSPVEAIKRFLAIGIGCRPEDIADRPEKGCERKNFKQWWSFKWRNLTFRYQPAQVAQQEPV